MYYSTNKTLRTDFSVEQERAEKVRQIADKIDCTSAFKKAADRWQNDASYSFREFDMFIRDCIIDMLDLNRDDRWQRLKKLSEAVRTELLRRNNAL